MSPSFYFSYHDRWEISLLSNIVSGFYELNPSAEVDEEREEGFCPGAVAENPEPVNPVLIFGSLSCEPSVLWFFITRPGYQAIIEANWLMISCLLQLFES